MRIKEKKMQKRILWGAAALVLLLVFAGCSQPTDFTYSGASPGNPGSLRADNTYDGLVLLTWTPVINVSGYEVYRYDTVDKTPAKLLAKLDRGATFYADFVGENNQLVDGRNYEYTVVALNSLVDTTGATQTALPAKNGSSKTSAKPKIPAKGSELSADLDVTVSEDGDFVLVTINNGQPNLGYWVNYQYGDNQFVFESAKLASWQAQPDEEETNGLATGENDWIFEKTKYIRFLKVGGDSTVTVGYYFAGNQNGWLGGYYGGGVSKTETVSYSVGASLSDITALTITRKPDYALLEWTYIPGATGYEIYKAQVSAPPEFGNLGGDIKITFISPWVKVDTSTPEQNSATTVLAKETLTSASGRYVYAVKAVGDGGASSNFFYAYELAYDYRTPQIVVNPRGDDSTKAEIKWGLGVPNNANTILSEEGATYSLQRLKVKATSYSGTPTLSNFEVDGEWETVSIATLDYVLDFAVVLDSPLVGESYIYRLTATRYGLSAEPTFDILNTGNFTKKTNFSVARYEGSDKKANNGYKALSLQITYGGDPNADRDRQIAVYRRKVADGGDSTPWDKLTTLSWTAKNKTGEYVVYDDTTVPKVEWKYEYRIEVDPGVDSIGVYNENPAKTVTDVRTYGYGYQLGAGLFGGKNVSGNVLGQYTVDSAQTLGVTGSTSWATKSGMVIIDYGFMTSDIATSTNVNEYKNEGPSIEGMTIVVDFAIFTVGTAPVPFTTLAGQKDIKANYGVSESQSFVIQKLPGSVLTNVDENGTSTTGQDTTFYIYYIELPKTTSATEAVTGEPTYGYFNAPPAVEDADSTKIKPTDFNNKRIEATGYEWGDDDPDVVEALLWLP
jgi:hypothetical protein